jgi:hypothetical protein
VVQTQPTLPPAAGAACSTLSPTRHVPNVVAALSSSPRARAALSKPDRKAAPIPGTLVHDKERGGYVALDARQRVELVVRRYRGGTII